MNTPKRIDYEIAKYSSYSTSYLPENIREDCPANQTSRWSSNTNTPPQFLVLRVARPSVITHIKFGKHEKTHVCNLKKFRVFGGLEEDKLQLLFDGGLKNDSVAETFELRHHDLGTGELAPIVLLKIVPMLSWGPSFNFSIWFVELLGHDDPFYVRDSLRRYDMSRELELVRLCLKHFRQQGYGQAFRALQAETGVQLEDARMTELHEALVRRGDFELCESMLVRFVNDGLADHFLAQRDYKAVWTQQQPQFGRQTQQCSPFHHQLDDGAAPRRPGMRGGHQLCADSANGLMYLFGGWDGFTDLSDLWQYDMATTVWTRLQANAEHHDGPRPRSCHKMVFDPVQRQIFVLGRYLDSASRTPENMASDFYVYDTQTQTWLMICEDTEAVGGPRLIFDHQMCLDAAEQTIYVFGGRVLTAAKQAPAGAGGDAAAVASGGAGGRDGGDSAQYSGLFSYHIPTNTWTEIFCDCEHPAAADPDTLSIKARVTHSMLFHERNRMLYIFGGQRGKEYTPEFLAYHVDTQRLSVVETTSDDGGAATMPQAGFTQRATIDTERDEIYVLSSLSKEKERRDLNLNSFWIFSLRRSAWMCIYRSDHSAEQCFTKAQSTCSEPCPRYAHQLVYDQRRQLHYLFGGNPGKNMLPQLRLDDFWVLRLEKPTRSQILRHNLFLIRRLHYEEIAREDPVRALHFLQTRLSESIDHSDPVQLREFHQLTSLLFRIRVQPAAQELSNTSRRSACTNSHTDGDRDLHRPPLIDSSATLCSSHDNSSSSSSGHHSNSADSAAADDDDGADNAPFGAGSGRVPTNKLGDVAAASSELRYASDDAASMTSSSESSMSSACSQPPDTGCCVGSTAATATASVTATALANQSTGSVALAELRLQQAQRLSDRFGGELADVQHRRSLLYNRIVSMLPADMVQPTAWLADVCRGVAEVKL